MTEPRIVEGVGTTSVGPRGSRGRAVEAAMTKVHMDCFAKGVTDPAAILKAKLMARDKVRRQFRAAADREAKAATRAAKKR